MPCNVALALLLVFIHGVNKCTRNLESGFFYRFVAVGERFIVKYFSRGLFLHADIQSVLGSCNARVFLFLNS